MKYRDIRTGAILEPTEEVAAMMAPNPNLVPIDDKPTGEKKPTTRKRAPSKRTKG